MECKKRLLKKVTVKQKINMQGDKMPKKNDKRKTEEINSLNKAQV